jgi:hypothetical protein
VQKREKRILRERREREGDTKKRMLRVILLILLYMNSSM